MNLIELNTLLKQLDIPVAYNHFKTPQKLPFICYLDVEGDTLKADNKVHHLSTVVNIELYTQHKDLQLEQTLETILNDNELPFDKGGSFFIEEEDMYETIYTIKLI